MATLNFLERKNELYSYKANLDAEERKERCLYLAPSLVYWLDGELQEMDKDKHSELLPIEQVMSMFDQFVSGHHMGRGEMKKLEPLGEHVWEFKPKDVRVFGYFYRPKKFIAICGEMKKNLVGTREKSTNKRYKPFKKQVIDFRKKINLDDPKYMKEELYGLI